MKATLRWAGLACMALAMLCVSNVKAADQPGSMQDVDPEVMKKMMTEAAKPGPEHEWFKEVEGKWKTEVTSYCMDPDNPQKSEGTAEFKVILGGRFLKQQFQGEFDGEKFEGYGVCGYDNVQKKYVGAWIDNMGTGIMTTEGQYDKEAKKMTETGKVATPLGPMQFKMVTQCEGDDQFTLTMSMVQPDGSEQKQMEIVYTRE